MIIDTLRTEAMEALIPAAHKHLAHTRPSPAGDEVAKKLLRAALQEEAMKKEVNARQAPVPARGTRIVGPSSILTLVVPILALVLALQTRSILFLDYVHVITGGTWTGIDLFMGLVMSRVMRGLLPEARAEIIRKLVPIMLFFMPALASVAITAGVYLAGWLGLDWFSPAMMAAAIIVIILSVQGFGFIMPNEVRIFLELRRDNPNLDKIVKLGMRNIYLSGSQTIFQMAIIFVMAYLATV